VSATEKIDAFQRRHPAVGFPLPVFYKFFDDQDNYVAALIA
jgi:membrane protein